MKEDFRRDTMRAIFIEAGKGDYTSVARQLEVYGTTLETMAFQRGWEAAEGRSYNHLIRGLLIGSLTGAFVTWVIMEVLTL